MLREDFIVVLLVESKAATDWIVAVEKLQVCGGNRTDFALTSLSD